ncbi:substrate-binding domain-containing protein, partial [Arachidicoccus sp.]|uniref:substrate-binding domain-containing protein n=1 Tax=Arachidicoccus sp. TaxID=1872624 RepID=UPI003D2008AC
MRKLITLKFHILLRQKSFLVLLSMIILSALQSCNTQKQEKAFKLGFSQCTGEDNWRKTMLEGMKRELSFHPGTELLYRDAHDDNNLQIQQVRDLINQHVDLLLISPNEAQPLTNVVEEAYSKGIPVVVIDRKTSSELYTSFVGADNNKIGELAGQYIAKLLNKEGNVIEIIGRAGSSPAIERQTGFSYAIKQYSGIKVTATVYGNWLKDEAYTELMKIKDKLSEADVVFAQNDVMALGAYEACKKLGITKKIKFIGVDGLAGPGGGLQLVNDKILDATILYPTGGEEAIQTAFKILNGEPFNKENTLQTFVIDSSNVRSLRLQAEKIHSQQNDIEKQQSLLEKQQHIYRSQSILLNIFIIALILVIILGCITYFILRKNRKINIKLAAKNNEIMIQRNKLLEMAEKTQELTEAKFLFFTNISHEFRTPLTLILGPLEDILSSPKLHFSTRANLEMVQKNVLRLLRLVNQLIDFRKADYEKMPLRATQNNLINFVIEITNAFSEMAKKKSIALSLNYNLKELNVWYDKNMLDKVLFNLLSNAFKFTNINGSIKVTIDITEKKNEVVIEIADTGIGMDEETAKHAFELFYQGNSNTYKGSGLGLSLSKELIKLHHGRIELESKKWQGSSFKIFLPIGNSHLHPNEILEEDATSSEQRQEDIKTYTNDILPVSLQQELQELEVKEYSILLIEDSDDLRGFLKYRLAPNYNIYEAATGNIGLSMVENPLKLTPSRHLKLTPV